MIARHIVFEVSEKFKVLVVEDMQGMRAKYLIIMEKLKMTFKAELKDSGYASAQ